MPHVDGRVGRIQCTFSASERNTRQGSSHWALPPLSAVLAARSWWTQPKRGLLSQQPLPLEWLFSSSTPVHHPWPSTSYVGPLPSPLLPSTLLMFLALAGHPRASCEYSS